MRLKIHKWRRFFQFGKVFVSGFAQSFGMKVPRDYTTCLQNSLVPDMEKLQVCSMGLQLDKLSKDERQEAKFPNLQCNPVNDTMTVHYLT